MRRSNWERQYRASLTRNAIRGVGTAIAPPVWTVFRISMRIKFTLVAAMLVSALHVPVYAQSGTADLGAAGWRAIQDSDGEAAHELFARALALNPNDAV